VAEFYRFGEEDKLESFEPSGFGLGDENLEERLEEWVEKNPHILMNGEKALVVGRQVPTDLGYSVDLLAVDRGGQAVIIELKKTKTPRQVIAQALEYAAYVANLDYGGLNSIALRYSGDRDMSWQSLEETHRETFPESYGEGANPIAWNNDQVIIIAGREVGRDIAAVIRYLRRHNIDVRALQIRPLKSGAERLLVVETVVGQEPMPSRITSPPLEPPAVEERIGESFPEATWPLLEQLREAFKGRLGLRERALAQPGLAYDAVDATGRWRGTFCQVFAFGPSVRRRYGKDLGEGLTVSFYSGGVQAAGGASPTLMEALRQRGFVTDIDKATGNLRLPISQAQEVDEALSVIETSLNKRTES